MELAITVITRELQTLCILRKSVQLGISVLKELQLIHLLQQLMTVQLDTIALLEQLLPYNALQVLTDQLLEEPPLLIVSQLLLDTGQEQAQVIILSTPAILDSTALLAPSALNKFRVPLAPLEEPVELLLLVTVLHVLQDISVQIWQQLLLKFVLRVIIVLYQQVFQPLVRVEDLENSLGLRPQLTVLSAQKEIIVLKLACEHLTDSAIQAITVLEAPQFQTPLMELQVMYVNLEVTAIWVPTSLTPAPLEPSTPTQVLSQKLIVLHALLDTIA